MHPYSITCFDMHVMAVATAMVVPLFAPPSPETFFCVSQSHRTVLQEKQIPYLIILTNAHWLHPSVINNDFFLIMWNLE